MHVYDAVYNTRVRLLTEAGIDFSPALYMCVIGCTVARGQPIARVKEKPATLTETTNMQG